MRVVVVWCLLRECLASCPWPEPWQDLAELEPEARRVALVVRGIAFRDCGHGRACDAAGKEATLACAESQVERFVASVEAAGFVVDVLVASYECPGATEEWLLTYDAEAASLPEASRAAEESQLDSLRRGLGLIRRRYAGVLVARSDLYFVSDLASLVDEPRLMFHADMSDGALYRTGGAPVVVENVTTTTDKLFWIPGPHLPCFLEAVEAGDCFRSGDDDDDPRWISGESCFPTMRRRLGAANLGFLRDDVCGASNGTFGDNGVGDSCYLVLPRALAAAKDDDRSSLVDGRDLGVYATGRCDRGSWSVVVVDKGRQRTTRRIRDDLRRRRRR